MRSLLLIFLTARAMSASPGQYALVFGGAAFVAEETKNVQNDFKTLHKSLIRHGFLVKSYFGDESAPDVASWFLKKFGLPVVSAVNATSVRSEIKNLVEGIENGKIVRGSKIMVVFDGHGGKVGDEHYVNAGESFFLGREFQNLRELSEKRDVHLGIVDFSCHAGTLLTLAGKNTCVISSSSDEGYTTSGAAQAFANAIAHGKSLEQVYLDFRNNFPWSGLPQISTGPGRAAGHLTAAFEDQSNPDHRYWLTDFETRSNLNLPLSFMTPDKLLLIQQQTAKENLANMFKDYTALFAQYQKILEKMVLIRKMRVIADRKITLPALTIGDRQLQPITFTWSEISDDNFVSQIVSMKEYVYNFCKQEKCSEEDKKLHEARIWQLNELILRKMKLQSNVLYRDFINQELEYKNSALKASRMASEFLPYERYFYSTFYEKAKSQENGAPNPCRNFQF